MPVKGNRQPGRGRRSSRLDRPTDESALGGCIVKDDVARGDFVPDAVYGGPQTVDMLGMVGVTTRPEAVAKDQ